MCITAIIEGFIWSVLWIIYVYVIVTKYPWQMMHDYPEDIQKAARLADPTEKQNKSAKLFGLAGSLIIFATLILFGLFYFENIEVTFLKVFTFIFIIAMTWNVIDLLVMNIRKIVKEHKAITIRAKDRSAFCLSYRRIADIG